MSRILSLDIGDRRIGVAVSDVTRLLASPLTPIRRASKSEDLARIVKLVRDYQVGLVLVGHPLNADETAGPQARRVERYAAELAEQLRAEGLDVPLLLWDEHGSTQRAQAAMIAGGRSARARKRTIDSVAASVILQDYLEATVAADEA